MRDYPLIILPLPDEEGGGYLAIAPDLPGCLSDGATPAKAAENAGDAVRAWLGVQAERGDPAPEPGSFLQGLLASALTDDQAAAVRERLREVADLGGNERLATLLAVGMR